MLGFAYVIDAYEHKRLKVSGRYAKHTSATVHLVGQRIWEGAHYPAHKGYKAWEYLDHLHHIFLDTHLIQ